MVLLNVFRISNEEEIFSHIFRQKLKNLTEILRLESIEFFVTTVLSAILVTKRALTLRLREHQANCRNQKQHSAVVDHSAIGNSWGFNRAKIVNTQRSTIKRKIAESLFIRNHSTVDGNKSSFPLSIFKL